MPTIIGLIVFLVSEDPWYKGFGIGLILGDLFS
jgi:hypothetical protein